MNNQSIVESALSYEGEVNFDIIGQLAGYNETELIWAKLFWESTFNDSWIYLSDEAIINWMGHKAGQSTMSNFTAQMKANYSDGLEYKEVSRTHPLVQKYMESFSVLVPKMDCLDYNNLKITL